MKIQDSDVILLRLQMLKYFDFDVTISQLINGIANYTSKEHKKLVNRAKEIQSEPEDESLDREWSLSMLEDDLFFINEAEKLSYELAIVALYKKIEITTKRAVSAAYPNVSTSSLHKINKLKDVLIKKGIQIESLPNYKAMDEVRCLSHDIKHNDSVVGKKLAAYKGWKKGEHLKNLDFAYRRLAPLCAVYMEKLVGTLIQKRRDLSSA